jgi:hypothetical protein
MSKVRLETEDREDPEGKIELGCTRGFLCEWLGRNKLKEWKTFLS